MKHAAALPWALFSIVACDSPSAPPSSALSPDAAVFPLPASKSKTEPGDNPWLNGLGGAASADHAPASDASLTHRTDPQDPTPSHQEQDDPSSHFTPLDPNAPDLPDPPSETLPEHRPQLELIEYLEGQGSDKVLSFFNRGTGVEGSCSVEVYVNGGSTPWRSMPLEPLPEASKTGTYCSAAVTGRACLGEISGSTFNGNDALLVRCNGQLTDSLGQLGYDPGAGWSSDTAPQLTTKDSHWLRCSGPDLQATDPFFIDAQWVLYPEGEELEAAPARCPTHLGPGGAAAQ